MEMEFSVGIRDKKSAVELYDKNTNVRGNRITLEWQDEELVTMSTAATTNYKWEIFIALTNTVEMESATDRGVYTIHALEDATRGYKYKERGNQGTEIKENTSVVGVNSEDGNVEVVGQHSGDGVCH